MMRLPLRSPLPTLVPLLLVIVAVAAAACSAGTDVEDSGPTVTATGPDESTSAPAGGSSDRATDEPTSTALPDAVAAVCTPYAAMVEAVEDAALGTTDPEAIAAELGPVMKEFAARLPSLERPPGVSVATWQGIQALAERILALPDEPTNAEIEAVESDLSERERAAVKTAADWLRANCPV